MRRRASPRAGLPPRQKRRGKPRAVRPPVPGVVELGEEQRRHLIDCCAFFRAQQFRPAEPGRYRAEDVSAVSREIDAALRRARGKRAR
jgi:hypothetical protein